MIIRFINKLLTFGLIFIVLIISIFFISSKIVKENADFRIKPNTKYLFLGHSHMQYAYDDSIILNSVNYSSGGESYFYMFQKLKAILNQKNSISTIFVEYSNNQIETTSNEVIWSDKYIEKSYPIYSIFTSFEDDLILIRNNPKSYIKCLNLAVKFNLTRIFENEYNFKKVAGGYSHLNRDKIDSLLKFQYDNLENRISINKLEPHYAISYLKKIIELGEEKGKRIILLRTPIHSDWPYRNNEDLFQNIRVKYFAKVEFIDLQNFPLSNSEFGDFNHVNYKGSKKLSRWFNNLLQKGYFDDKVEQNDLNLLMNNVSILN